MGTPARPTGACIACYRPPHDLLHITSRPPVTAVRCHGLMEGPPFRHSSPHLYGIFASTSFPTSPITATTISSSSGGAGAPPTTQIHPSGHHRIRSNRCCRNGPPPPPPWTTPTTAAERGAPLRRSRCCLRCSRVRFHAACSGREGGRALEGAGGVRWFKHHLSRPDMQHGGPGECVSLHMLRLDFSL